MISGDLSSAPMCGSVLVRENLLNVHLASQLVSYLKKYQGCENGDLENGVVVPYRKQVVLTENGENDDLQSTHKTRGCAPQTPETDENDENGG